MFHNQIMNKNLLKNILHHFHYTVDMQKTIEHLFMHHFKSNH